MNKNQPCYQSPFYNSILHIPINLNHSSTLKHEAYELRINNDGVTITFATYSGYIYALETLSQLLNKN
jgi:N-acetyl-beta-hexosaminidase